MCYLIGCTRVKIKHFELKLIFSKSIYKMLTDYIINLK